MPTITDADKNALFLEAHTHYVWLDKPVSDEQLRELYELAKFPPTAANTNPMRIVFVKSPEAKARLIPTLSPSNVEKVRTSPVTAIVAYDTLFYEKLPKLMPYADFASGFRKAGPEAGAKTGIQGGTLGGAYLILAARSLGLDCGPMGGFDAAKVDAEFFADGQYKSLFLLNIGYGDESKRFPRNPRLDFEEACRIE